MGSIDPDFDDCPDLTKSAPTLLQEFQTRLDEALELTPSQAADYDPAALISQIEPFQDAPQLIDPILEKSVTGVCRALLEDRRPWQFRVLYVLVKIRGAKTVCRFLFNEVPLVQKILGFAEACDATNSSWEERYIILLWLSGLALTPFNLDTVGENVPDRLFEVSQKYLGAAGREREAASTSLARFISRPDTLSIYLPKFIDSSSGADDSAESSKQSIFWTLGTVSSMAQIFAICQAHDLKPYIQPLSQLLQTLKKNPEAASNTQLRKLLCKATYRLALRALEVSESEVPTAVEVCLDELLTKSLADKDTLVRYSASKAFSRVALAMTKIDSDGIFVSEIIDSLLLSSFPLNKAMGDSKTADRWHGGLLALAELLRRHVLPLPAYAPQLFDKIDSGLRFEIRKSTHALGANVRDSACYVAWSLFRHYPDLLSSTSTAAPTQKLVKGVLADLVLVGCFDREINNRRAAAAAVQECIGRHAGAVASLETGVALVQALDYFAIGNRANAFLEVSRRIAKLGIASAGGGEMVEFLLNGAVTSWDIEVRKLAGQAIAGLAKDTETELETIETVLVIAERAAGGGTIDEQHGSLFTLGELLSVVDSSTDLSQTVLPRVVQLLENLKFPPHVAMTLYDGALRVISASASRLQTDAEVPPIFYSILDNALSRTDDNAQTKVLHASARAATADFSPSQVNVLEWLSFAKAGKFGYMLALGSLRFEIPEQVIADICRIAASSERQYGVALRVASVDTLHSLLDAKKALVAQKYKSEIFWSLVYALQDYTILPTRGDVGSQTRLASISALTAHAETLCADQTTTATAEAATACVANLIRISLEKMDKLRLRAVACLSALLPHAASLVPSAAALLAIIAQKTDQDATSSSAKEYYTRMINLCVCAETVFAQAAITGIAASVGGGTGESVVRASSEAIVQFMTCTDDDEVDDKRRRFVENVVALFVQKPAVVANPADGTKPTPPKRDFELCEVVVLLFETGSMATYASSSMYVSIYNKAARLLQLATKANSIPRLESLIGLFSGIVEATGVGSKVREAAVRKLVSLLIGDMRRVRQPAAEALFLLLSSGAENDIQPDDETEEESGGIDELLTSTDWASVSEPAMLKDAEEKILKALLG
ncbi:armadillo-type protein [Myxozyma melibiosi]|uniref:Armadillo-type protein n=1 Tax=Myxozyma melibiosi TaxID=54550 RepID=A0ABR1F225_9ASCO